MRAAVPFNYASVTSGEIERECWSATRTADGLVEQIARVPDHLRTFKNTLQPLDEIGRVISQAIGRYGFLAQVSSVPEIRQSAHRQQERMDTFLTGLGFREEIADALRAYTKTADSSTLTGIENRFLIHALRDFRRNGMGMGFNERRSLQNRKERLASIGVAFQRNIDDFEDEILVNRDELSGLPDSYIDTLRRSSVDDVERYRVSLDYPELHPFLSSADNPQLREDLFRKNHCKAADDNVEILEEAIFLRDEIARCLEYESWAAYVLEVRMAETPNAVDAFLSDLEFRVRPKAEEDMAVLLGSRNSHLHDSGSIDLWDWSYYTQRVIKEKHGVDPFQLAEYFPLDATLKGLFKVYESLVGVRFLPHANANSWHPSVQFFDIVDDRSGKMLGHFYLDLHPRAGKFSHAAAFTLQPGCVLSDGSYQVPVSAIVANFTTPTAHSPALLRHSEVRTLFHEFGHILHQTLTRVRFQRFSGTNVERDFVEAPSQMLEHWCWQPSILRDFSCHYQTGDPLDSNLIRNLISAKNVSSGIATLRQIYFSRLDLAYHAAGSSKDTDLIARELHDITNFPFPDGTHFQAGFGHLFGYDAGYYGYLWAKVYGDDMFSRVETKGLNDAAIGEDYRKIILETGGSEDGNVLLRKFLGREPNSDAFLMDLGIVS